MFAPEERRLIISICMLLLLGAMVRSCRQKVTVEDLPAEQREKLERLPETPASESDERSN
jgi:hypothetical protein